MSHDLRFALRFLTRRPGISLVVVLTLGMGIGSVTAVFDFANLFFWRPPPVVRPSEVVEVYTASVHGFIGPYGLSSFPDFEAYRDATEAFSGMAAFLMEEATLDTGEWTEPVEVWPVTGEYFPVLGLRSARGRLLAPGDDRPAAAPVAVVSYPLARRLGAGGTVLGRVVRLGSTACTVVGVAPAGFSGTMAGSRPDVFVPSHLAPGLLDPDTGWLTDDTLQRWNLLGRLRAGVSAEAAAAELARHAQHLDRVRRLPDLERRVTVVPARMGHPIDRRRAGPGLKMLGTAVALLLLIACANISNLLLAHATNRRQEMGIRRSVGASGRRLFRQLLTESLVLALAGGAVGMLFAWWARRLFALFLGAEAVAEMRFDHRVLGLSLAACLAATLLCGLAPALITSRVDLASALRTRTGRAVGGRRLRAGPLLAAAQVALSLVLLTSTALLLVNLWQLSRADLGFDLDHLLRAQLDLGQTRTSHREAGELFHRIEERAAAIPGVRSVGRVLIVPPALLDADLRFRLPETLETLHSSRLNIVDDGYFRTLRIPLLRGRSFDERDAVSGRGVVVVNQVLADQLWPGADPVGRRVLVERHRPDEPGPGFEVIGVVGSIHQYVLSRAPEPILYFSADQRPRTRMVVVLRASGEPGALWSALRSELRRLDPSLAPVETSTLEDYRWEALVVERFESQTLGAFGVAGLLVAVLGVFGVTSYAVSRQRREIAVRMAVGASPGGVLGLVLRRGMTLSLAGAGVGLLASFWADRLLRGLFPRLGDTQPAGISWAIALFLLLAAAGAAYLPARRASRVDPATVLRSE